MASAGLASAAQAYQLLGLHQGATKEEVKDAFRRLVHQYHPDKCAPDVRVASEAKFKDIKNAYETILRVQAGYTPPKPAAPPNPGAAQAYWHAHSTDGRVPWGRFAGWETEWAFYRAMMKTSKSSLLTLSLAGLISIPIITAVAMGVQSPEDSGTWRSAKTEGLDVFKQHHRVNGSNVTSSPFAMSDQLDSYRYRQRRINEAQEQQHNNASSSQ